MYVRIFVRMRVQVQVWMWGESGRRLAYKEKLGLSAVKMTNDVPRIPTNSNNHTPQISQHVTSKKVPIPNFKNQRKIKLFREKNTQKSPKTTSIPHNQIPLITQLLNPDHTY